MNDEQIHPMSQNAFSFHQPSDRLRPPTDLARYFRQYARERPQVVALWCFGIGFVLGWKLKPW